MAKAIEGKTVIQLSGWEHWRIVGDFNMWQLQQYEDKETK